MGSVETYVTTAEIRKFKIRNRNYSLISTEITVLSAQDQSLATRWRQHSRNQTISPSFGP